MLKISKIILEKILSQIQNGRSEEERMDRVQIYYDKY
jgi:hypothetical protein